MRALANHDVPAVEEVILRLSTELHPEHLSAKEITARILSREPDRREIDTAAQAITGLREFELLRARADDTVEPTAAALRAVTLLRT